MIRSASLDKLTRRRGACFIVYIPSLPPPHRRRLRCRPMSWSPKAQVSVTGAVGWEWAGTRKRAAAVEGIGQEELSMRDLG
ncbi:hypothetical protein MRB53_027374 [Persea americana]|uniref:Uncharacterized protein n=1 Tax=Persea americana TaxID=3435 RepID=A0ACC2LLF5_PERAE|nr:hypothetical protein MRB53_027374 [Persea americana]